MIKMKFSFRLLLPIFLFMLGRAFGGFENLLDNINYAGILAGDVDGIGAHVISVDLKILKKVIDPLLTEEEHAASVDGPKNVIDDEQYLLLMDKPPSSASNGNIKLEALKNATIDLNEMLQFGLKSLKSGVYKSEGITTKIILGDDTSVRKTDIPEETLNAEEIIELVDQFLEIAAPDDTYDDINLFLVNSAMSSLGDLANHLACEGTMNAIEAKIKTLKPVKKSGMSSDTTESETVTPMNYDTCNFMVLNTESELPEVSIENGMNQIRTYANDGGFRCLKAVCPEIVLADENVGITSCERFSNGICSFECPTGMTISGSSKIVCGSDGKWDGAPPTCN
ncbi:Uncharacterised protein at_DN0742 [Pycnogonum litorale]